MTLPVFPRSLLYDAFGNNPRMVSAFEELISALTDAVEQAEAVPGVSAALQSTAFLLLSANKALTASRILTAGQGIDLADDGSRITVRVSDLIPKIEGGYPATFITTGGTHLILPEVGQLATIQDIATVVSGAVTSFNTRTGAVTLLSADVTSALGYTPYNATNPAGYISGITSSMVTTALGYVPTSVTGLTGSQSVAAFKTGLSLVKADVGLGSVDNTADAAKNVLTATKLFTARNFTISGDGSWTVSFDGSSDVTAALTLAAVNANVGTFGSATQVAQITFDAKGRATAAANVTITPAASSITGGAALTKTDDTNVTLTLAGSPATALLAAASLTLGWTGTLGVARGGTNIASYAIGDILYASGSTTLSKLAAVATGNVLISGGVTTAPSWGKVGLATHVSGTLPIANGGTNQTSLGDITRTNDTNVTLTLGGTPTGALITSTSFTLGWSGQLAVTRGGSGLSSSVLGDLWYGSAANAMAALAGNTTSTKKWLNQTGTGTVSAAPAWSTIAASDIASGAALTKTDDTNITLTLGGSPTAALLAAASITVSWSGQLGVTRGGTGLSTTTQGDIFYADASNSIAKLAKNTTASRYLSNSGTSNNPAWAQVDLTNGVTGTLPVGSGGTGSTSASGARANLGLDTMATQAAIAVAITGGTAYGLSGQFTGNSVSGSGSGVEVLHDGTIGYVQSFSRSAVAWKDLYVRGLTLHFFCNGSDMMSISSGGVVKISTAPGNYANDAAAATGGVNVGEIYRNGSVLMIRVT